jgi:phenylacetate-coenzyme A ligase PaaK-like adenylate-forming protein
MNGDKGKLLSNKCKCGLPHPLMGKISGRISDTLTFSNGVSVSGEYLTTIFDDYTDEISQFQIIQDSKESLQIHLVPISGKNMEPIVKKIISDLISRLGNDIFIKPIIKDSIKHHKGKIRYIINRVSDN